MRSILPTARPRAALLAAVALSACAAGYDPDAPVVFDAAQAVPVDQAVPHLAEAVGQRIAIRGVPRQNEGSCSGVQPLARKDWMLTGETQCLWVNGQTEEVRLLDLRGSRSDDEISVVGRLIRTDSGVYVLVVDR